MNNNRPKITFRQWAFYAIGIVLLALLSFLIWTCSLLLPIVWLCSGHVFVMRLDYVWCEYNDTYYVNSYVRVGFVFFFLITVVLLPLLGLWRITTHPFAGFRRVAYLALGGVLSAFPISAAIDVTVLVTRLMVVMGITQKRLLGVALGVACIVVYPVFLYFVCRKTDPKKH